MVQGTTSPLWPMRPITVVGVTRCPSLAVIASRWLSFVIRPPPWSTQTQVPASMSEALALQPASMSPTCSTPAPAA